MAEADYNIFVNQAARNITAWSQRQGFADASRQNMLEKLMLVVTELSEAAEDVRHEEWEHFEEELADALIRLLNIAGAMQIDLERAVVRKMVLNEARPWRHGKTC